jgi:hypothetical protein
VSKTARLKRREFEAMSTEAAQFDDDARGRQALADWTDVLLRLRSRPVRAAAERGFSGLLAGPLARSMIDRSAREMIPISCQGEAQ